MNIVTADFSESRLSAFEAADSRAAWCVTLERADGRQIMREAWGGFPEPEPTEEPTE